MPELYFQLFIIFTNLILLSFGGYYILKLRAKEKILETKENKMDADYHHVVDDALSKERQILDDATHSADQIITGANYIKQGAQETVDRAIQQIVTEIQKESMNTAQLFLQSYTASLQQISSQSVTDFQAIVKELEGNLQRDIKLFHETLLPNLEKELDEYKQMRLKETDKMITRVVQKASQEVLNKTIPLGDHQTLMLEALEKAKKEGLFE